MAPEATATVGVEAVTAADVDAPTGVEIVAPDPAGIRRGELPTSLASAVALAVTAWLIEFFIAWTGSTLDSVTLDCA